jgi:hypothetical protein
MSKFHLSIKSFILLAAIILFVSSCTKDDTVNTSYVGTWSLTLSQSGMSMKDNMTFTKDGFTDIMQINNPVTNKWVDYIKTIGTISVSGSTMTTTYTGIGISTIDPLTGPTGTITMYNTGNSNFQSLLTVAGMPLSFDSKFSISGNNMTMMTDLNGDGDYTDAGETSVYIKQ